jgi:hypothetical protein
MLRPLPQQYHRQKNQMTDEIITFEDEEECLNNNDDGINNDVNLNFKKKINQEQPKSNAN